MSAADAILAEHAEALRALCQRLHVRKLEIFGSATTTDFDPERSDFDFLYEFEDYSSVGLADRFFELMEGLESLFGRKVDIVDSTAIENPYFLRKINTQRRVLYAA